jgi:peptidoglycan/xylan/chitin deacetylase (PgdA/CDA1 family)
VTFSALYYTGLRMLGLPTAAREFRNAAVVLCYHNVVSDAQTSIGGPGLHIAHSRFRKQMRWLAGNYTVIPLRELLARVRTGRSLRDTAAVCFDDAYAGVFEHAWPVLQELRVSATVFVVASAPGRRERFWWDRAAVQRAQSNRARQQWLTALRGDEAAILGSLPGAEREEPTEAALLPADWGVIAPAVSAGLELGVHSATHRSLPTLDDDELTYEIEASREIIARNTGATPEVFAFPYGRWDGRVRRRVKQAGYRAAFTLDYGLVTPDADPWALPRVNVPAGIPDSAYQAWAAGLRLRHPWRT